MAIIYAIIEYNKNILGLGRYFIAGLESYFVADYWTGRDFVI